jgi:hypothetical protein
LREKLRFAGLTLCPPFRPASAANLGFCEKLRFSFGTLSPPFRAIASCFSRSMEAKPRLEVEDFLGISIAAAIISSLELSMAKRQTFGGDKGFKCPNLRSGRDALPTPFAKAPGWINDATTGSASFRHERAVRHRPWRPRHRAAADQASRSSHMIWLIGRLISGNSDGANDGGGDIPSGASASGDDTAGGCQGHRLRRLQHRQRHLRRQHQVDLRPGLLARRPAPFLRTRLEHEPLQGPQAKPLLRQFSASSACVSPIYGLGQPLYFETSASQKFGVCG